MVITGLGFGGAETQVVNIARVLRLRGWRVTVVSLIWPASHVEQLKAHGIPVHSLRMRRRIPDPRAILRLARLIRREKPDIVHSHMVHANLLTRVTRCVAPMPALVCTAHNTCECSERGGPTWHKELLYRVTDRLCDHTTIVCHAGFRHYVRRRAAPASRLEVIPTGVDCAEFRPDPEKRRQARLDLAIPEGRFVFLAVGRLVAQKDYPNLLRAAALLRRRRWTLLIAGSGPLQRDLEQLCSQLYLFDRVRFLGVKPDIRSLYLAADAFVMSSRVEGLPVVLLEAAASGLAAVVTDAGGACEVVVSGKTGVVVPKEDHRALAGAMEQMLDMPVSRRTQCGADARARATEEFELGKVVSRWESLYARCLRRAAARHTEITPLRSGTRSPRANP